MASCDSAKKETAETARRHTDSRQPGGNSPSRWKRDSITSACRNRSLRRCVTTALSADGEVPVGRCIAYAWRIAVQYQRAMERAVDAISSRSFVKCNLREPLYIVVAFVKNIDIAARIFELCVPMKNVVAGRSRPVVGGEGPRAVGNPQIRKSSGSTHSMWNSALRDGRH